MVQFSFEDGEKPLIKSKDGYWELIYIFILKRHSVEQFYCGGHYLPSQRSGYC